jgi:uncharacterized membrane protein
VQHNQNSISYNRPNTPNPPVGKTLNATQQKTPLKTAYLSFCPHTIRKFMEGITILLLLVLIIITITSIGTLRSHVKQLTNEVLSMRQQLQQLLNRPAPKAEPQQEPAKPKPYVPETQWVPKPIIPKEEPPAPPPVPKPLVPPPSATEIPTPELPKPVVPIPPIRTDAPVVFPSPTAPPPKPPRPGFFERNPDLEKFIGENLISKIGIAILVIAIGFFVKYAIDRDWIGPAGRVGIGVLCGGILIGLAHRLQRSYKAFSSVLVGGGLAIFYFSIALAYKDYALFSQTVAFIIMVVITGFAIMLSLLYDRQEVAIIALVGGFAVPFLVSNGSGNYVTLFTYLLVLNGGLLIIAYRKAWRLLNAIAFAATVLLFAGWLMSLPSATPHGTFIGGLLFATAFYLLFLAVNLAHNIREQKKFIASDFGILFASNALFFSAGLYLLYGADAGNYKGVFCAALGVLNFALAWVLLRRRNIDRIILYLLVGVTLTFVSLTAPLQLNGHFITLFWAAETVVLLWLLQKSGIRILQWGLLAVWICSIISLLMDWNAVYGSPYSGTQLLPILANRGFITTLFVAAANSVLFRLMKATEGPNHFTVLDPAVLRRVWGGAALILLYLSGAIELAFQFNTRYPESSPAVLYLQLYTGMFILVLNTLVRREVLRLPHLLTLLFATCYLLYYLIAAPGSYGIQEHLLNAGQRGGHFIAHWLSAILTALVFYQLLTNLRAQKRFVEFHTPLTWIAAAFAVVFVSIELQFLVNAIAFRGANSWHGIRQTYVRVGLTIIWGLCSFAFMWLGMRHKYRPLRIVSLTLFTITLLKLFLVDIRELGPGGKIAAFFSLGVLLLVVSFMYQRLKRLIIEDERKNDETI